MKHRLWIGCVVLVLPAFGARADAAPGEAAGPRPIRCAQPSARSEAPLQTLTPGAPCDDARRFFDAYVPVVPIGPSRTMFTTLVMPPVPWLLTDGEAGTPARGRVAFHLSRLSDERRFTDNHANTFVFDGEEQVATLELVSPRLCVGAFDRSIGFHVAGSLTAHTLGYAWFAGLRNFIENTIGSADAGIRAAHDDTGRDLSITRGAGPTTDLLDAAPVWKARLALKVPLPDVSVGRMRLSTSFSVGATAPAFGGHSESGNAAVQLDTTLAFALPLSERWRLTGAFNLTLPGKSTTLERFDVEHRTLVAGAISSIEWWATPSLAVALGVTFNGPYTRDGDAPTDLSSVYLNLGVLWRPSDRAEVHVLFAENPGNLIATDGDPTTKYSFFTQRDADFSLTFGGSFDF